MAIILTEDIKSLNQDLFKTYQSLDKTFFDLSPDPNNEALIIVSKLLSTQMNNPVTPGLIKYVTGSMNKSHLYNTLQIPKKSGGYRLLEIPRKSLKFVQTGLMLTLTNNSIPHKSAKAFIRGQNLKTHCNIHKNKKFILNFDIKDFFPSITWPRVLGMFNSWPISFDPTISRILANIATYNGHIPQGAPSSPIISNLICRRLDSRLFKWSISKNLSYSRYADDMTFSTNMYCDFDSYISIIRKTINEEGFETNESKTRLLTKDKRQIVTGLVLNRKVNIKKEYIRNLRALLFNVKTFGLNSQLYKRSLFNDKTNEINYLSGKISKKEFNDLREKQKKSWLITNSINIYSRKPHFPYNGNRGAEYQFLQMLKGKIEFVGMIKGRDNSIYIRFINILNEIKSDNKILNAIEFTFTKDLENLFESLNIPSINKYSSIKRKIKKLSDQEIYKKISQLISEYGIIELNINVSKEIFSDDVLVERSYLLQTIYHRFLNPKLLAYFYERFNKPHIFNGFFHGPNDLDLPEEYSMESGCVDIFRIHNNCQGLLNVWNRYLPNKIKNDLGEFLSKIKKILKNDEHPYENSEIRNEIIKNQKNKYRFGSNHINLEKELIFITEGINKDYNGKINFEILTIDNKNIYTFTPSILQGLENIINSMADNSVNKNITISSKRFIGAEVMYKIKIVDIDGVFDWGTPDLQFSSKLKKAVKYLRGHADWHINAKLSNSSGYNWNVMKNEFDMTEQQNNYIEHIITIYSPKL